ncbi:hypothetical protein R3P38DRAFT_3588213 [Favolaschia claudopus]|uniref:Uncharacterized protein n=1 Tax=Favolaschia claudopus TaxID=2862362 RepID=A0AAW0AHD6_9AGAR
MSGWEENSTESLRNRTKIAEIDRILDVVNQLCSSFQEKPRLRLPKEADLALQTTVQENKRYMSRYVGKKSHVSGGFGRKKYDDSRPVTSLAEWTQLSYRSDTPVLIPSTSSPHAVKLVVTCCHPVKVIRTATFEIDLKPSAHNYKNPSSPPVMNSGGRRLRLIDRLGPPVIPPGQPRPLTLSERISPRTVRSKVFKKRSLRRRAQKLNLDGVRQGPVSASGSSSYCDRRVAIRSPEISPPSSKEIIYSAASAPSSFLRMGEACNIPSLLVVQLAALRSTIVESKFFIPQGALSQGGLRSCIDSPQVTVDLYCLPTILCNCAALSSLSGKKLSATLDTFRAQTTWPRDGTLFIDLNDDAGGKSWLPWELIEPESAPKG